MSAVKILRIGIRPPGFNPGFASYINIEQVVQGTQRVVVLSKRLKVRSMVSGT